MRKHPEYTCHECHQPLSRHRAIIPVTLSGVGYLAEIHRSCLPRARRACRKIAASYFRRYFGSPDPLMAWSDPEPDWQTIDF